MFNFLVLKKNPLGILFFLLVSFQSYAMECDYNTESNSFVTAVQVDYYNDAAWISTRLGDQTKKVYYRKLDGYQKDVAIVNMANIALLFGHRINVCYWSSGGNFVLGGIEISLTN